MGENRKIEKFKYDLLESVSFYTDIEHYYSTIIDLDEKYDETLEDYDWATWFGKSHGKITSMASATLSNAMKIFGNLSGKAEERLYQVYQEICALSEEEQKEIWGKKRNLEEKDMLFEALTSNWDYRYSQHEALEWFLEVLDTGFVEGNENMQDEN